MIDTPTDAAPVATTGGPSTIVSGEGRVDSKLVIIGSGPTGLTLGALLARRGMEVISVDQDSGPAGDGSWRRP